MSYKNTVTVLRVFAIKPMIIIAWLVHSFCVFHKKFNGQQFFQEALYNKYPMTTKYTRSSIGPYLLNRTTYFCIMRYDK